MSRGKKVLVCRFPWCKSSQWGQLPIPSWCQWDHGAEWRCPLLAPRSSVSLSCAVQLLWPLLRSTAGVCCYSASLLCYLITALSGVSTHHRYKYLLSLLTEKNAQPKSWELFYSGTLLRTIAQDSSLSDHSEELLQRGKGGARIYSFSWGKNKQTQAYGWTWKDYY